MLQSITYKEAGNPGQALAHERLAFRELNYELRERFPDEQVHINFKPFGDDELVCQRIGTMM
jgi:hypothetical protein